MSADTPAIPGRPTPGHATSGHAGLGSGEAHVEHLPDHEQAGHGTLRGYVTGFVLSVILTAIPFWLVMGHVFASSRVTAFLVMGLGVVQIVVHMIYFLHMSTSSEGGWSLLALIFTLVLVVIALSGSIWVMYHLNANMMPGMDHGMVPGTMPGMDSGMDPGRMPGASSGTGMPAMSPDAMRQMP